MKAARFVYFLAFSTSGAECPLERLVNQGWEVQKAGAKGWIPNDFGVMQREIGEKVKSSHR